MQRQRLLRTSKPKGEESFLGYLLRLTQDNGYESISWILKLAAIKPPQNYHIWPVVFGNEVDFSLLSSLTNVDIGQLKSLLYLPADGYSHHLIFGQSIHRAIFQLLPAKVCPQCLRETNYLHKIWDLMAVTACPMHQTILIDQCPNCKHIINPNRKNVSICPCQFDWRYISPHLVAGQELAFVHQIHRVCRLSFDNNIATYVKNNSLTGLDLQSLLSAVLLMSGLYNQVGALNWRTSLLKARNLDRHQLFSKAFLLYENWPDNYYRFLDCQQMQVNDSSGETLLFKKLRYFNEELNSVASPLRFIRDALHEYIIMKLHDDSTADWLKRKIAPLLSQRFVTQSSAMLRLDIDCFILKKLVQQGILKAVVYKLAKENVYLIEEATIKEFRYWLDGSITA